MHDPEVVDVLRRRLDEMTQRHAKEVAELRAALDGLEVDVPPAPTVNSIPAPEPNPYQPPPLPVEVEEPKWHEVAEPEFEAPKEYGPPPLPTAAREIDFGRVWFVRIGVVILLTGLVFLGNYAYQNWIRELSNGLRLTALLVLAAAWVETGRRLTFRDHLRRFGEVVMAGGLGFSYYCVYAAHHVERLRVIDHAPSAGVLLVAAAAGIAAVAWKRGSPVMATMGMLLASYTTVVQPLGWMACVSNGALAGMGLFFLTRKGWSTPGWVAMAGMYLAFLVWQVLGAAGRGGEDLAVLWFLAPSWLLFAVAGVVPSGGAALSARARAWFAGANNALFFMLFGNLWAWHYGGENFWKVAGVLAVVLIVLGAMGRRSLPVAGAVNLSQGLLLLGLALILRLDGFHLALAFAGQAAALAVFYRKFGGRTEAVFSLLAGVAAAGWICLALDRPPIWSAMVAAAVLGQATWVLRMAAGRERWRLFREFARGAAAAMFWSALVAFSVGVLWRMDRDLFHPAAAMAAFALGAAALRIDPKRRMRELAWGALVLLVFAITLLGYEAIEFGVSKMTMLAALAFHLAGAWLWRADGGLADDPLDNPRDDPRPLGWLHAVLAGATAWAACEFSGFEAQTRFLMTMAAALGLACTAIGLRAGRLSIIGGFLALLAVLFAWVLHQTIVEPAWAYFAAAALALAALVPGFLLPMRERISLDARRGGAVLFRAAAFLAWAVAVNRAGGLHTIDGWAATTMVLMIVAMSLRVKIPLESIGFLAIATVSLYLAMLTSSWGRIQVVDGAWRGAWVLVAMFLVIFTHRERKALIANPELRAMVITSMACLACVTTTLWATQMLVWRTGWDGTVALWSVIGLLTVSAGLWQRLRGLRLAGLLLLMIALAKLFALDVWDYTAFTRVVSFIALGIALILLGLFYNHFAATLKKWL